MALSKNIKVTFCGKEIEFQNAYHKIDFIAGVKDNLQMTVSVYDEERLNKICEKQYIFTPNLDKDSVNYHKQGYEYLKKLEEYIDATDILEEC